MPRTALLLALAGAAAAWLVGCADSDVSRAVGARCDTDRECSESCYTGGDFPGGFCSVHCRDDGDCPGDTRCAPQLEGGICLFACRSDSDCDFLGSRWSCESQQGASGNVCLGD